MKIAIPTNEGLYISGHFGRTRAFRIIEINDGKIINEEFRENNFTGHAQGMHEHHDHDHNHEHQQHSHASIFNALGDCNVVIANGMGRRLYDDLIAKNIQVFITHEQIITNAILLFLENKLDNNEGTCCNH